MTCETWSNKLPLLRRLRAVWVETIYHEQTVGFLAQDECIEHRQVQANTDGIEAAKVIEGLQQFVSHEHGCAANDLDPLDDAPCTCGLRSFFNPWNRKEAP